MEAKQLQDTRAFSLEDVKEIGASPGPCLSVLFSLDSTPGETQKNAIRMRHASEEAKAKLEEKGVDATRIPELLAPLGDTLDPEHWSGEPKSLAIYRSPDLFRAYPVPHPVPDTVVVADHFYIKPLLAGLNAPSHYFLLALSQKNIRLLRCTGEHAHEVALPDEVPTTLWQDKHTDQPDHTQDNRSSAGPDQGGMRGVAFTTNTDRESKPEYLAHFYKHVAKGVAEALKGETAPLVVAGVEYEIPLYATENSYPHLVSEGVHGAPDGMKMPDLLERARKCVEPAFEAPLHDALARFEKDLGNGRASSTLREVVPAAYEGRVLELVVSENAEYMGNFDEATYQVRGHKQPLPGDEDLLNAAALQTIFHGGRVFIVPAAKVPHGAPAVATFRY